MGELPYAEGPGDVSSLLLKPEDVRLIQAMRQQSEKLIVILISGRPMVITPEFDIPDAWVAAWLPGSEGGGVADVLFGKQVFTGKLPYTWPRNDSQLPININNVKVTEGCDAPMFPYGYGLGMDWARSRTNSSLGVIVRETNNVFFIDTRRRSTKQLQQKAVKGKR